MTTFYRGLLITVIVFFGQRSLNELASLQNDVSGLKADMAVLKAEANTQMVARAEAKTKLDAVEGRLNTFMQFAYQNYAVNESEE